MPDSLNSQSIKTTAIQGECVCDKGKNVNGHKRHLEVDMLGSLMAVVITIPAAPIRKSVSLAFRRLSGACEQLRRIWIDNAYRQQLLGWVAARCLFCLEVLLSADERKRWR